MSLRIENKYRIYPKKKFQLFDFLKKNGAKKLFPDRYIKSIYFDNKNFDCYKESLEGTVPRKKIRLRNYSKNLQDLTNLSLEIKINSVEGRYKDTMKVKSYSKLLRNGYCDNVYGYCDPKVIVVYKREYYQLNQFRVTIDDNIEYSLFDKYMNFKRKKKKMYQ